jgi:tetratricopeptide (TPR) repeat protein
MSKSFLLFSFFVLTITSAFSQNADSLLTALDTAKNEQKVKVLNELFRANIQSDPVKALDYTREALALATEINDKKGMAASYNNFGVAYKNQGVLDRSLEYYFKSLKSYEELQNKEGIATTKNNIATIYSIKGDYPEAKRHLEESYKLFVELGDDVKILGSINNLGNLYSDLQMFDKANELFDQALKISAKIKEPGSDPLDNMGNVYFRQGDYERAIDFYKKALDIQRDNNDRIGMLNTITNIGIAYTKAKQYKLAQQYLNEAEQMAITMEVFSSLPTILKNNAENQFNLGNAKQAYQTLVLYDSIREEIYGQESSRNIARMEVAMDLQDKEKEFEVLKKESEIQTLELHKTRLIIISAILVVLIVLASVNFYYMGKNKVKKHLGNLSKPR